MKQTPKLVKSPISSRWYIVTKYKWIDEETGQFEALEKFDITDQINMYFMEREQYM